MILIYQKTEKSFTADECIEALRQYAVLNGTQGLRGLKPENDVEETEKVAEYLRSLSRVDRGLLKKDEAETERGRVIGELNRAR